eukprot:1807522-Pleurochrysis_carterae.AAC.2
MWGKDNAQCIFDLRSLARIRAAGTYRHCLHKTFADNEHLLLWIRRNKSCVGFVVGRPACRAKPI